MSRDDLIGIVMEESTENGLYMGTLTAEDIADAMIAAGYRKPRTITTVEELDALPDAVLILTEQGGYWESIKRMDRKNWWKEPGATSVVPSDDLTLPAIVLHEPTP